MPTASSILFQFNEIFFFFFFVYSTVLTIRFENIQFIVSGICFYILSEFIMNSSTSSLSDRTEERIKEPARVHKALKRGPVSFETKGVAEGDSSEPEKATS